jgi:hypothetical protein
MAEDVVEAVMQVVGCAPLKDDKDRLACFDKAAATLKTAGVPSGPETANTRDIVSSFAPGDFKVVDPDDIHVAPRKFVGKPIETRNVRCFYADKNDYPTRWVLWLVLPPFLYWTTRVWLKAHRGELHDDPLVFAVTDKQSWAVAGLIGGALIVATSNIVLR